MPKKLTSQQKVDRENFVFAKIRLGLSRKQVELSVCDEFQVAIRTAANIYNAAIESLADEHPGHQRRNRAVILEVLYSQANAFQLDIQTVQEQIQIKLNLQEQHQVIKTQLADSSLSKTEQEDLQAKLEVLPTVRPQAIVQMIVAKSRIRSQLIQTISEIAQIHGLHTDMPLLQAISVLASSEMISPEVAGRMLVAVEDMSSSLEKAFHEHSLALETNERDLN
jgi:hypothetical protein